MELNSRNETDMGQAAYDAYVLSVGGASPITGDMLPAYAELRPIIKTAWMAAARAVATAVRSERDE